ncbi:Putative Condensation domain-containing protein [Colletotrichum destructivum]|uniref:Condensation domain-containing protein n=1 Tax=Colletotrichum destructivum TaxID=34406 RepID=A0AAX4IMQ7_9PEZI|nr:Putative Condensation domain-containing protein [Colletotrichum destructivum]
MCFSQRIRDGRPVQGLLASSAFELEHFADANKDDFKQVMDKFKTHLAAAIRNACKQLRLSPFHFYLAVIQIFLARQANFQDVCVGLVAANRDSSLDDSVFRMVGYFVNVLPVQTRIDPNQSFSTIIKSASRKALSAFAHAGVPFDVLLDALELRDGRAATRRRCSRRPSTTALPGADGSRWLWVATVG